MLPKPFFVQTDAGVHVEHDAVQARASDVRFRHHLHPLLLLRREVPRDDHLTGDGAFDHRGQARLARVRVLKDPRVPVRLFDWRAVHIENGVSVAIPNHLGEGQLRRMCADLVEASDEVHRDTTTATLRAIMSAQESAG